MRRGSKPKFLILDGKLMGVDLSSDFTSEHEWGIQRTKDAFGITDDKESIGIAKRKISIVPDSLVWVADKTSAGFAFRPYWSLYDDKPLTDEVISKRVLSNEELIEYSFSKEKRPLRAAWSESDFAVVSSDAKEKEMLLEIFDAFKQKNICIAFLGGKLFDNAALCLVIADRLTKEIIDLWESKDNETILVKKAFAESGIEKLLEEKGKRYYALSPKFDVNGQLIFWLNPMEQQIYDSGWMTLQDLIDWTNNTGKVIRKAKANAR